MSLIQSCSQWPMYLPFILFYVNTIINITINCQNPLTAFLKFRLLKFITNLSAVSSGMGYQTYPVYDSSHPNP
jgi:hypothetical protein